MVLSVTSARELEIDEAQHFVAEGAAFIDLRPTAAYLDVHIHGSLALQYEFGPGMAGRARDCIPLDVPFVVLHHEGLDVKEVTAALRGKGFAVLGYVPDGLTAWGNVNGAFASTEVVKSSSAPAETVVDVGDPGVRIYPEARLISVEKLWGRTGEMTEERLAILAGRGVRASLAVGMLERAGVQEIVFWTHTA